MADKSIIGQAVAGLMTLITLIVIGTVKGTKTGLWTALLIALIFLLLLIVAVLILKVVTRNNEKSEKKDKAILGGHFANLVLWLCAFVIVCISFAKGGLVNDGSVVQQTSEDYPNYGMGQQNIHPKDIPCNEMTPTLPICQDMQSECNMRFNECLELQKAGIGGASGGSVAAIICLILTLLFLIGITYNDYKAYKEEEYPVNDEEGNDIDAGLMASGRDDHVSQTNSQYNARLEERSVPSRMV